MERKIYMYHFFAYISRMKHIKRWGLMRNTQEENIKEHSLDVAVIAHALAVIKNTYFGGQVSPERMLALGIYHEVGEVMTGDLATPIKYFNPKIKKAYGEIEKMTLGKILRMLPEEMQGEYKKYLFHEGNPEYALVKAADKICAYIKCVEEIKSGNMEFEKAKNNIAADLAAMQAPEVQFFIEKFLPSYALTLDELN